MEINWRDMFGRYLEMVTRAEGVNYLELDGGFDDEGEPCDRWTEAERAAIEALAAELPSVRV